MKTLFELQQQLLTEHHDRYREFTRLLVALSVAFITLLAAATTVPSALVQASLLFQLLSLGCGLIVQHQIMLDPLYQLHEAESAQAHPQESAGRHSHPASPAQPVARTLRRRPSKKERVAYKAQLTCFVLSFVLITLHMLLPS